MFISVRLPTYNAEQCLHLAVDSVPAQIHVDIQPFLIDHRSSDGTLQISRNHEVQNPGVRVLSHENWGMGKSLIHADWIAGTEDQAEVT